MPNSKRTEKEIKNPNKKAYIGDKKVEEKVQRIEFEESSFETIDKAVLKYIDERLNISVDTNLGFKKVPVLWVDSPLDDSKPHECREEPCIGICYSCRQHTGGTRCNGRLNHCSSPNKPKEDSRISECIFKADVWKRYMATSTSQTYRIRNNNYSFSYVGSC